MPRKVNKSYIKVFNDEIVAEEQYYRGDKGLPTADSVYEWTPEMILALQRCQTDIKYFAENFFTRPTILFAIISITWPFFFSCLKY